MSSSLEVEQALESYWRSVISFGRNVASYKFALGQCLLGFEKDQVEVVKLEQLAEPFADNLCVHLKLEDRQTTSRSRPSATSAASSVEGSSISRSCWIRLSNSGSIT